MSSLPTNYESLTVSGISDFSHIDLIPTIKTTIDAKGNFIDIKPTDHNVNCCYVPTQPINYINLNTIDPKGNIIELK